MDKDPDRERCVAVTLELAEVMKRHDVGGVVMVVSEEAAAWLQVIPPWAALECRKEGFRLRLRVSKADPSITERTENTLHLIGCVRDMASDLANVWGRLFRMAREQLRLHGNELVHVPFDAGERPDPEGGKQN